MITERDLQEAIAECQGMRNPNASTCIKLAAFLTIQRELYGEHQEVTGHSYDAQPSTGDVIRYDSETEFAEMINGMRQEDLLPIIDELMSTIQVVQPRIYASVLRKIEEKY